MKVASTPEEEVRQQLLHKLTSQLGYPPHLLAVEKQLSELPHLKGMSGLPHRRIDLLCYARGSFTPLLLIECKQGDEEAEDQVMGYNHFVGAPFVGIARKGEAFLIHPVRLDFIPSYAQLMERISECL